MQLKRSSKDECKRLATEANAAIEQVGRLDLIVAQAQIEGQGLQGELLTANKRCATLEVQLECLEKQHELEEQELQRKVQAAERERSAWQEEAQRLEEARGNGREREDALAEELIGLKQQCELKESEVEELITKLKWLTLTLTLTSIGGTDH